MTASSVCVLYVADTSGGSKRAWTDNLPEPPESSAAKRRTPSPTTTAAKPNRLASRAGVPLRQYFSLSPELQAQALAAAPSAHVAWVAGITPQNAAQVTFEAPMPSEAAGASGAPGEQQQPGGQSNGAAAGTTHGAHASTMRWGVEEAHEELLAAGLNSKHVTKEWVANHYKWVVWKLASYERLFPADCAGRALSREGVVQQLRSRWAGVSSCMLATRTPHHMTAACDDPAPMLCFVSGR